jgi:hypothetical protein
MAKTSKNKPSADEIAEMASRGEDISAHFTNKFTVVRPVRRVRGSTSVASCHKDAAGKGAE